MYVLLIGRPDAQAAQLFQVLQGLAPHLTLRVRSPQLAAQQTGELPALVMLDAEQAGVAALAVLKKLRERPGWQTLPMAVLTDAPSSEQMSVASRLNAAYAVKPVAAADLAWMLSRLIGLVPALPVISRSHLPDLVAHQ